MPSITYQYVPDQTVFVVTDGTVKSGIVTQVEIDVDSTKTDITYWVLLSDDNVATPYDEDKVFASCRAAPGYQDVVFLTNVDNVVSPTALAAGSPVLVGSPLPYVGSPPVLVLSAEVLVDGTIPVTISHTVIGGETFDDLVSEIDTQLGSYATAILYQNNIRIKSATKSASSSIKIGIGSPAEENYFKYLNMFTGLAAPVGGLGSGALEALSDDLCER